MKKFAIVGKGEVAKLHANNIKRRGKLVAVCGEDELECEEVASEYGARFYAGIDKMLAVEKEIDVVVICSAIGHHAEHIIKSLQAGKDVLCESPLCLTKAAAWQIIETEKYCGRRLYLIQAPAFYLPLDLKRYFIDQIDGKISSFNLLLAADLPLSFLAGVHGKQFPGGGLLYTTFAPFIELLVSVFGEVEAVEGFAPGDYDRSVEVERHGVIVLKMKSGIVGTLQWADMLSVGNEINKLIVFSDAGLASAQLNAQDLVNFRSGAVLEEKALRSLNESFYGPVYENLLDVLDGKGREFPTTLDGAKTVEAIENIYKALR